MWKARNARDRYEVVAFFIEVLFTFPITSTLKILHNLYVYFIVKVSSTIFGMFHSLILARPASLIIIFNAIFSCHVPFRRKCCINDFFCSLLNKTSQLHSDKTTYSILTHMHTTTNTNTHTYMHRHTRIQTREHEHTHTHTHMGK